MSLIIPGNPSPFVMNRKYTGNDSPFPVVTVLDNDTVVPSTLASNPNSVPWLNNFGQIIQAGIYEFSAWVQAITGTGAAGQYLNALDPFSNKLEIVSLDGLNGSFASLGGNTIDWIWGVILQEQLPYSLTWQFLIPGATTGWDLSVHSTISQIART